MARSFIQITSALIIHILALCGFLFHSYYVSDQYFRYESYAYIGLELNDGIITESVNLCFSLGEIISPDARTWNETCSNQSLSNSVAGELSNMSMKQLFEKTPDPGTKNLISSCVYRPDKWTVIESNQCSDRFTISRFLTGSTMCYQFTERSDKNLTNMMVNRSPDYQSIVRIFTLTSDFEAAQRISAVVFDGNLPDKSRDYKTELPIFRLTRRKTGFTIAYLTASYTYKKLLEPPYDTMCVHKNQSDYYDCRRSCLLEKFGPMDLVPSTELWITPFEKRLFLPNNKKDSLPNADRYEFECESTCNFKPCYSSFSKTFTVTGKDMTWSLSGHGISFALLTPIDPDCIINTYATMTFIEYFSFIVGCFGAWFGISALSLDPYKLFASRHHEPSESFVVRFDNQTWKCEQVGSR